MTNNADYIKAVNAGIYPAREKREAELFHVIREMERALEHCRHRPHEHNPPKIFSITDCDVINTALSLAREVLKT